MTKKLNFWTELKNRWKAESPVFFVKLQNFGAWLSATGAAIAALGIIDLFGIPGLAASIAGAFAIAGVVVTAVAKLAVKNPDYNTLDKKVEVE